MTIEKLLWMCCECRKIKDEDGKIFGEKDNPEKYNRLLKEYGKNITHGYCPEDYEKKIESIRKMKR